MDGAGSESYKIEDTGGCCVEHFDLAARELDDWLLN